MFTCCINMVEALICDNANLRNTWLNVRLPIRSLHWHECKKWVASSWWSITTRDDVLCLCLIRRRFIYCLSVHKAFILNLWLLYFSNRGCWSWGTIVWNAKKVQQWIGVILFGLLYNHRLTIACTFICLNGAAILFHWGWCLFSCPFVLINWVISWWLLEGHPRKETECVGTWLLFNFWRSWCCRFLDLSCACIQIHASHEVKCRHSRSSTCCWSIIVRGGNSTWCFKFLICYLSFLGNCLLIVWLFWTWRWSHAGKDIV